MHRSTRPLVVALAALVAVFGAACGGDDADGPSSTTAQVVATAAEAAPAPAEVTGDITVFAAASLTEAFTEIGERFMAANPDAEVTFSFAASSELVAQIDEGAPADVFASADQANMEELTAAGGTAGAPQTFATNALEIIVAPGNPKGVTGVADLADPDLIVVTCAPEVPIGRYASGVFAKAGVTVTPKSYEQNVKGVVNKVTSGEADAGIVYTTDVTAAGGAGEGVDIPADLNVVAEYPIVVTEGAPNPAGAAAFVDFVVGETGHEVLASFGFTAP